MSGNLTRPGTSTGHSRPARYSRASRERGLALAYLRLYSPAPQRVLRRMDVDVAELRHELCELGIARARRHAVELGGLCSEFDVDAFAHNLASLPDAQLAVLDQAVWEIRHFDN